MMYFYRVGWSVANLFLITFILVSCTKQHIVSVELIIPENTPKSEAIYIVGNMPEIGNWNPGKIKMVQKNDTTYVYQWTVRPEQRIEFKVTRGSWSNQATFETKVIPGNIDIIIRKNEIITLHPVSWTDIDFSGTSGITGTVFRHEKFKNKELPHARDILVWVPPSYDKDLTKKYPVIYMHDGQNVIDPSLSFIGSEWQADESADRLIKELKMQEVIIVGIFNTPTRTYDYSDSLGKAYADLLVNTIKPFVDKNYRTLADAKNTAVIGSSMGGLIAFYIAWWYPDVFSMSGCFSSAFKIRQFDATKHVLNYSGPKKDIKFYFDCGKGDELERLLYPGMLEMRDLLVERGYVEGKDLWVVTDEEAIHNETAWAKRLPAVFEWFYGSK